MFLDDCLTVLARCVIDSILYLDALACYGYNGIWKNTNTPAGEFLN
jgi:hypothetical protein